MSIYQALADLEKNGDWGVLCTIVHSQGSTPRHAGSKMLIYADGRIVGSVGGGEVELRVRQEAAEVMKDGVARLLHYSMVSPERGDVGVCGGSLEVFVEPIFPRPTVVVIGAGHVGKAVVHLAHWLGFQVAVADDRAEFCTPEENPEADAFYPVPMAELPNRLRIGPSTYLVLTTRGSSVDVEGLPALLAAKPGYIGVIGSKRRWAVTRKALLEAGVAESELNVVHSPMGLELEAETPEEIAVSIMAEIIMLRRRGTGKQMKE